jgi:hypothetical protein
MPGRVAADSSATTSVTVSIEDAGSLTVGFAEFEDGYVFRNELGESRLKVSAIEGDIATAVIRVEWLDTRLDATRTPFGVLLSMTDLVSTESAPGNDEPAVISASQVAVIEVNDEVLESPLTLNEPQRIYESPSEPEAGQGSLELKLRLTIPPSSFPLRYQAMFEVQVSPADEDL